MHGFGRYQVLLCGLTGRLVSIPTTIAICGGHLQQGIGKAMREAVRAYRAATAVAI